MMAWRGLSGIAAATALAAACTSTSGLSDGKTDEQGDGGPRGVDGGGRSDAAGDTGSSDPDAGAAQDGAVNCASPSSFTIFCEDFEANPQIFWQPDTLGAGSVAQIAPRPGGTGKAFESVLAAE